MAHLKPKRIRGRTYWYVVESRRVGRRVKTVNLAYLGRADDILARWNKLDSPTDRLKSFSHGGAAVLLSLAGRLQLASLIDRYARAPRGGGRAHQVLSVGRTLVLASVGRTLHPTSKQGWASWARGTTLGKLWGFDPGRITSQYFWDQMDRLPRGSFGPLQAELGRRVLTRFGVSAESLFYDTTNFYTFIDSRNHRCDLAQRGWNKQKRNDLRQFQMGMLVSRDGWVPLLARFYRGNLNDVTTFPGALKAIGEQCAELGIVRERVTLVCDKGNISKKNWKLLDESRIGHVVSVVPSQYTEHSARPLEEFCGVKVPDVGEAMCLRLRAAVAGRERTLVVLDSPTLRSGQLRGLDQQLKPVLFALSCLEHSLRTARRRRSRESLERQIQGAVAPAAVRRILRYELTENKGRSGYWNLDWWIDMDAYRELRERVFGRRVLATDRHDWPTGEIVRAYWGQSEAELVFQRMKDPEFLAVRPQYHWTDQKIEVHGLCCVIGYLLAALVRRHARRMGYTEGLPRLLEMLSGIRMVLRMEERGRAGRPRLRWQMEEADRGALRLYRSLVLPQYDLGPTPSGG